MSRMAVPFTLSMSDLKIEKSEGFTLLEVMLAVLVLGLVMAMVSVTLSVSLRVVDEAQNSSDLRYRAQVTLDRLRKDLTSAYLDPDLDFSSGGEETNGASVQVLLRFTSYAHVTFTGRDHRGPALITYALVPDKEREGSFLLLRGDTLLTPFEQPDETTSGPLLLLCDRLKGVKFTYVDETGEEVADWSTSVQESREEVEESRRLPSAVSCRLEFVGTGTRKEALTVTARFILPSGMFRSQNSEER